MRRKGHQIFRQTGLCLECGGPLHTDKIEYHLEWQRNHYRFRDVPVFVCVECGEVWLKSETLFRLANISAAQRREASVRGRQTAGLKIPSCLLPDLLF